jgi:hypothetical protein
MRSDSVCLRAVAGLVAATALLWATSARAQAPDPAPAGAPPTPGAPAPGAPAPAAVPPAPGAADPGVPPPPAAGAPVPGAPAPAPAAAPAAPSGPGQLTDEELANQTRFRFAIHLAGGPWFVPDRTGGAGGLGLQLGAQINDMIGVYYSGTYAIGVAGSSSTGNAGASAGVFVYNAVMLDLTFERMFQIGVGPSIDSLAFGSVDVGTAGNKSTALAGSYLGVQGRLGLVFGGKKPGKSGRFMLGLEIHPTFADVVPISAFITIGGGKF